MLSTLNFQCLGIRFQYPGRTCWLFGRRGLWCWHCRVQRGAIYRAPSVAGYRSSGGLRRVLKAFGFRAYDTSGAIPKAHSHVWRARVESTMMSRKPTNLNPKLPRPKHQRILLGQTRSSTNQEDPYCALNLTSSRNLWLGLWA